MQRISNLVVIDPKKLSREQNNILLSFIDMLNPDMNALLTAGYYRFTDAGEDSRPVNLTFYLKAPVIFRGILDVTNPSLNKPDVMERLLAKTASKFMMEPGCYCLPVNDGDKSYLHYDLYVLKYVLIARMMHSGIQYYDVVDKLKGSVGRGSFGCVYTLFGSLKPKYSTFGDLIFSHGNNKRLAKFQESRSRYVIDKMNAVKKEFRLSKSIPYLKPRDCKIRNDSLLRSYMTIRRVKGASLNVWLSKDKDGSCVLSVRDRLAICNRLVKELRRYFLDNTIHHRDIKPENIMVDKDGDYWVVKFIDLGLSVEASAADIELCGTPLYIAPELNVRAYNELSEIYALGRVMALIWRDRELERYDGMTAFQFYNIRFNEKTIAFRLFEGVILSEEMKALLLDTLVKMTSFERNSRPNLNEVDELFENIRLANYLSDVPEDQRHHLLAAKSIAIRLSDFLNDVYHCASNRLMTLYEMKKVMMDAIDQLPDHPVAVKLFIEILGIESLYLCTDKKSLSLMVNSIMLAYTELYDDWSIIMGKLYHLCEHVKSSPSSYDSKKTEQLLQHFKYAEKFQAKIAACHLDLDSLVDLINSMMHKVDNLNEAYQYFTRDASFSECNEHRLG